MSTYNENVIVLRDTVILPGAVVSLLIGRRASLAALNSSLQDNVGSNIVLLLQKDSNIDDPSIDDIDKFGVLAKIIQVLAMPDNTIKILVEVQQRVEAHQLQKSECFTCEYSVMQSGFDRDKTSVYHKKLQAAIKEYFNLLGKSSEKLKNILYDVKDFSLYMDTICQNLDFPLDLRLTVLYTVNAFERCEIILKRLYKLTNDLKLDQQIDLVMKQDIEKDQAVYLSEKRLKALKKVIGEPKSKTEDEFDIFAKKINALPLEDKSKQRLLNDLSKLKTMPVASAEATVIKSHLEWIIDVPWQKAKLPKLQIDKVNKILSSNHYGLEKVKDRILEFIAVSIKLQANPKGAILCLVGPPGVGKTSLGKSIAKAMKREYVRIALGGVRDESEIRGHRKTYIGAMPGRIIKAMRKAGATNPVILLDEIDKIGSDLRGDPASALLEVLDPEQNKAFNDHYLEVDYDLSDVVFIATANTLDINPALLDRMEIIEINSYTEQEKIAIVKNHLYKKSLASCGLNSREVKITDDAIIAIIQKYTKESGVRLVEQKILQVLRKVTRKIIAQEQNSFVIKSNDLSEYLGAERYPADLTAKPDKVGEVNGLAWTSYGGVLLKVEAIKVPGKGEFKYTGSLGKVMQESMQAAYSVVRSRLDQIGLDAKHIDKYDIHVHAPDGATPKDGPSAGIAISTAIISTLVKAPVKANFAMTGEVTLQGNVLKIGGLKEKLLAAVRNNITDVIIPKANEPDLLEIMPLVKDDLKIHLCDSIDDVIAKVLHYDLPAMITNCAVDD